MDVVELLKRPEGKTLEFKRDLSSPDGVLRTVVAFANTAGGTVVIGGEDATRLAALVGRGLLRAIGSGPRDPRRQCVRTETPRRSARSARRKR